MASTTIRFYGFTGNPVGRSHGAVSEYTAHVTHESESDNWERDRYVLRAIARKLTGKRSTDTLASFGAEQRANAMARAIERKAGHVRVPTEHGDVHFQILSISTKA